MRKKTKLKVVLEGPGKIQGQWTGYWEDSDVLVQTRAKLESFALDEAAVHGVTWRVKSVSITFPPLNPTPRTRRAKG